MNKQLLETANSYKGCLSHLATIEFRRLHSNDDDEPLKMGNHAVSDEARILCSKAYRLLGHKTQVVTAPQSALTRNRKTHVMEVTAISVVTADLLGLNIDLSRSISLGHDTGHVPFGHQGETYMARAMGRKDFCHEVMAPIVAQKIERKGKGINLTFQTLEGMMCHSGNTAREGMTQEAWNVRHTDKFAYIFADYNDVTMRLKYPVSSELAILMNEFGSSQRERTSTAMAALIVESKECGKVSFEHSNYAKKFKRLRELMYEVYPRITQQNPQSVMEPVLEFLAHLGIGDPFLLLALMTDRDVIHLASQPMKDMSHLHQTAIGEIIPHLADIGSIDLCDPCLNW